MADRRKEPEQASPTAGISRREFLKSGTAGAVGAGVLHAAAAPADAPPAPGKVLGPGPVPLTLTVNGKPHKLRLEPRVTLLDALRGPLGLTGAKRVCDRGSCGACTVLLDGRAVYACSLPAVAVQGRPIVTVEGLGTPERPHPLQAAFVEHDAQQCGFCTPGFVMASASLLERNPHPSAEAIREALGGNLCRCGTYAGIRRAVAAAAASNAPDEAGDA